MDAVKIKLLNLMNPMKKLILGSLLFIGCLSVRAQSSNLVMFTAQGEKFTLYVNGARINAAPESNVKATGINADFVKIRVVFLDNGQEISKGVMIYDETTPPPVEVTYQIKPNKKGSYNIQHVSTSNIEVPTLTTTTTPVQVVTTSSPVSTTTVTTTQVTNEPAVTNSISMNAGAGENASLNMSVKDDNGNNVSFNMSVNVGDTKESVKTSSTTSSTKTVTTTQTSYSSPSTTSVTTTSATCAAMNQNDFQELVASIDDQAAEENRLAIAKQAIDDSCLSTKQVINVLGLFAGEETRLEFAKYAYLRTSDRDKYFNVNSALYSQESVKELSEYIKTTR